MQFILCQKHNKVQKVAHKVTTNCYVCMNRYCQQSFIPLCASCKPQHRDHSNKLLTLQDITFLIQRLLKSPFKQLSGYIDEAVSAMKKFKLIQENKRRIQVLEKEIFQQVISLVEATQGLVHQYAKCKNKVTELGDMLVNVQTPQVFRQVSTKSREYFSNLQYNYQKDKFQYGNNLIREKFQVRRKSYQRTRRKMQEVKDYSMKVIEVILANDDSDEQEDIVYKKKIYEVLKKELQSQEVANKQYGKLDRNHQVSMSNKKKQQQHAHSSSGMSSSNSKGSSSVSINSNIAINNHVNNNNNHYNNNNNNNNNNKITINDKSKKHLQQDISKSSNVLLLSSIQSSSTSTVTVDSQCQTIQCGMLIKEYQQKIKQNQLKIKTIQHQNAKSITEMKNKITLLVKEKQNILKQSLIKDEKHQIKLKQVQQLQCKLRVNLQKKIQKQKQQQVKFLKIIQLANWKPILNNDIIQF